MITSFNVNIMKHVLDYVYFFASAQESRLNPNLRYQLNDRQSEGGLLYEFLSGDMQLLDPAFTSPYYV